MADEPKKEEKKDEAEGEVTLKLPFKLSGKLVLWLLLLLTGGSTGYTLTETLGLRTHVEEKAKLTEQVDAATYKALADRATDLLVRVSVLESQVQRLERDSRRMVSVSSVPKPDEPVAAMAAPPKPALPKLPSYDDIREEVQRAAR